MPFNLDANPDNADWVKRYTWDIPASNPEELYAYLNARGISVEQFKKLQVYQVNQYTLPWLQDIQQPDTISP